MSSTENKTYESVVKQRISVDKKWTTVENKQHDKQKKKQENILLQSIFGNKTVKQDFVNSDQIVNTEKNAHMHTLLTNLNQENANLEKRCNHIEWTCHTKMYKNSSSNKICPFIHPERN